MIALLAALVVLGAIGGLAAALAPWLCTPSLRNSTMRPAFTYRRNRAPGCL
jgi:hypothetical protein